MCRLDNLESKLVSPIIIEQRIENDKEKKLLIEASIDDDSDKDDNMEDEV
jgi:hypothetical protein